MLKQRQGMAFIGAVTLLIGGCQTWETPPQNLMKNADVIVSFKSSKAVSQICAAVYKSLQGKRGPNMRACAFAKNAAEEPIVVIPNPCEFDELYASLLCHELAHINQFARNEAPSHVGWFKGLQRGAASQKTAKAFAALNNEVIDATPMSEPKKTAEAPAATDAPDDIPTLRGPRKESAQ